MFSPIDKNKLLKNDKRKHKRFIKSVLRKQKFQSISKRQESDHLYNLKIQYKVFTARKESFFKRFGYFITPGSGSLVVEIPEEFCLCTNYSKCIATTKEFASSIYDYLGNEIVLDFSKCKRADTAALFLLQILRLELTEIIDSMKDRFTHLKLVTEIKLIVSKKPDVVRLLITTGYPVDIKKFNDQNEEVVQMQPIDHMGYFRGKASQQHIRENRKPVVEQKVVGYLNKCLDRHKYELTEDDKNSLGGIIGEVLSNAEDHSLSDRWFITANFSADLKESHDSMVGELNITIMNFGLSFYEAFEKTKIHNHYIYKEVENLVSNTKKLNPKMKFGDEQLFTLVMMSDQVSRLKYQEDSRGTGTIKFLQSFIEIGDFEDRKNGYVPNLSLFTGNTHLICDNELKPFLKDTVYCLSLNPENDLRVAPRESHLKILNEKFPGTLLSVKIYLNKKHLDKKYGGVSNEN